MDFFCFQEHPILKPSPLFLDLRHRPAMLSVRNRFCQKQANQHSAYCLKLLFYITDFWQKLPLYYLMWIRIMRVSLKFFLVFFFLHLADNTVFVYFRLLYSNSYFPFVHCYKRLSCISFPSVKSRSEDFSGTGGGRIFISKNIMLKHYYNIYARTSATVWPTTAAPTIAATPTMALLPASRKDYIETKPKWLPTSKPHQILATCCLQRRQTRELMKDYENLPLHICIFSRWLQITA